MPLNDLRIAYVHSMAFPSSEANAFDSVWSASALADEADTTLFVREMTLSKQEIKNFYYVPDSKLQIRSMRLDRIPVRLRAIDKDLYPRRLRRTFLHSRAWNDAKHQNVLYLRDPKLMRYFGLNRAKYPQLLKWIFIYESHDPLGINANALKGENPFEPKDPQEYQRRQAVLQAAREFDALICNTQALASDLQRWSQGRLTPHFITLASPLARPAQPPAIHFGEEIVLGYIGTIDQFRGVDLVLDALPLLPENFRLRLVGRYREEYGSEPDWLQKRLANSDLHSRVDLEITDRIADVAKEIDRCDILIQPASKHILDARYASPQKAFGYMMRGKPILVADVPCHHELFSDEINGLFYPLSKEGFAAKAIALANSPELAQKIARGAWEQAANYTFERRANDILALIDHIREGRAASAAHSSS